MLSNQQMKFFVAPVQGHTDAAWRCFHHKIYGENLKYFTPFMRCEHGEMRLKDLRDFANPLNKDISLEPQVIFRNAEELELLVGRLVAASAKSVNLNLGCPFPPQMSRGRGAAFIRNMAETEKLPSVFAKYPEVHFSIKMRLGVERPDEWKGIIGILNSVNLENIYVHPRVARQNYSGDLYMDDFAEILEESKNPVVFNGDIRTPDDMTRIAETFPAVKGIMVARGILARPSLVAEYIEGEWDKKKRLEMMLRFHNELLGNYKKCLCGDSQILSKIKPFWEYAGPEIGRKIWKTIRKATSLNKYQAAVADIINLT